MANATSAFGRGGGFRPRPHEKILVYPEYRGNGVMASLGNITENLHAGLLFVDFMRDKIGLHVNGAARILSNEELLPARFLRRPASRCR